eukprot:COSAG06_NODE_7832_length_2361_cov_1.629089_1_plen_152_part_00
MRSTPSLLLPGLALALLCAAAVASSGGGAVVATQHECAAGDAGCDAAAAQPFVPSDEWQEVLPGQTAPPSCDLRIELETGKEFARKKPQESGGLEVVEEPEEPLDPAAAAARDAKKTAKMYEILMGLPVRPRCCCAPSGASVPALSVSVPS